jgi:hypothetical protein
MCYTITVDIEKEPTELCLTHVPGNGKLEQTVKYGKQAAPSRSEVKRAVDYYIETGHNAPNKGPSMQAVDRHDVGFEVVISLGGAESANKK